MILNNEGGCWNPFTGEHASACKAKITITLTDCHLLLGATTAHSELRQCVIKWSTFIVNNKKKVETFIRVDELLIKEGFVSASTYVLQGILLRSQLPFLVPQLERGFSNITYVVQKISIKFS